MYLCRGPFARADGTGAKHVAYRKMRKMEVAGLPGSFLPLEMRPEMAFIRPCKHRSETNSHVTFRTGGVAVGLSPALTLWRRGPFFDVNTAIGVTERDP